MTLKVGTTAPDFTAQTANGQDVHLHDLRGQWVLLYFYPRDFTPGCTTEACRLNDNLANFRSTGATVIGVSSQTRSSHERFQAKHGLGFSLVADTDRSVGDAYEVPMRGLRTKTSARVSFLIDPQGKIAEVWEKVSPATHAQEVLKAIEREAEVGTAPGG